MRDFPFLGRIRNSVTTIKNSKFESKAIGIRESKDIKIEGRIQFDCLDVIRREYKLRSYTLNAVCAEFLGTQKEDVHVSDTHMRNSKLTYHTRVHQKNWCEICSLCVADSSWIVASAVARIPCSVFSIRSSANYRTVRMRLVVV